MKLFDLRSHGTTFTTEVLAGMTTFITMSYIIFVNPNILSQTGMPFGALVVTTCLASAHLIWTFLMAVFAKKSPSFSEGV